MKIRKQIRKQILATALAGSMMGLAACSGGSSGTQDVGSRGNEATSRAFYARAIDGYLAGSTVFVDLNENGKLDAFEPRALTDSDGFFSYNHRTSTDYCTTGGRAEHCLRGTVDTGAEVVIRVTGGYDTVTQLPFHGMLSLRSSDLNRDDMRLVTPVSSMVADSASDAQSKLDALIAAGVLDGSMHANPMNGLGAAMTRAQLTAMISRMVGDVGELAYGPSFQDVKIDAWSTSYIEMAAQLGMIQGTQTPTFGATYSSREELAALAKRALFQVMNPGQTMPTAFQLPNATLTNPFFDQIAGLVQLNEEMLDAVHGRPSAEELLAILRTQALLAERVLVNPTDRELPDATEWVRNQLAQGNGLGSDLTQLGGDNIDLSALIDPDFNFDPISNSVSASAKIPAEVASTFAALVNTSFGISVDKSDEQGAALFFLRGGDSGARSGEIDVCVRYRSDDGDFDTTSSSDRNGAMLIGGRWSLLADHTLTLNVDVVGGVRSLLIKAVSGSGLDRDYRFDFGGGDLSKWAGSAPAAFASGAVPTSDAACKATLIERFGQM